MRVDEIIRQKAEELRSVHARDPGRLDELKLRGRPGRTPQAGRSRLTGVWMGVAAIVTVLVLFSPLLFLPGPGSGGTLQDPPVDSDPVTAKDGLEFANPEHVRLRFSQELTLECHDLEVIDNNGFDSFEMDIWIDHLSGYTRFGVEYPDGSTHDLIFKGLPGEWEEAWGRGRDLGRDAGCRETDEGGGYTQSVAGWAALDKSTLWFESYLKPASPIDGGVIINHEGTPIEAMSIGPRTYVVERLFTAGSAFRLQFILDEPELRVIEEQRFIQVPGGFEATAAIEVLETGPTALPSGIFDTSAFTALWGRDPVPTTEDPGP